MNPASLARAGWPGRSAWSLVALLMVGLLLPVASSAQGAADATAVNIAGRQRMLTQRMVKAWCAVGQGVLPERSRQQLAHAVELFERQAATLSALALDAAARAALDRASSLWHELRPLLEGEVSRERTPELVGRAEALLEASETVVRELERGAPAGEVARLVNVSGRQRMLSQRLAKLYFLRAWGFGDDELAAQLAAASREFTDALALLVAAPQNTDQILEELEAVNLQWSWFRFAIDLEGARTHLLVVDDSSESILNGMDAITALYQALETR